MRNKERFFEFLGALAGVAISVNACAALAQTWEPPDGCEGFLTVQQKGCMLSNHYICEGDPEGHQWRVDFIEQGPVFASVIDYETQWIRSYNLFDNTVDRLAENAPDPASISELLKSGIDTYDFTVAQDGGGETRWRGADQLTGETLEIGGHEFLVMSYTSQSNDAEGATLHRGTNLVSEEWRLFLPSISASIDPNGEESPERDNSPVRIIVPGEPGFFASAPIYDCGVTDAAYASE